MDYNFVIPTGTNLEQIDSWNLMAAELIKNDGL